MGYRGKSDREMRFETFSKAQLETLTGPHSYESAITGLRLPSGEIIVNFKQETNYGLLKEVAGILGAEIVTVKGTWTFTPTLQEEDEKDVGNTI